MAQCRFRMLCFFVLLGVSASLLAQSIPSSIFPAQAQIAQVSRTPGWGGFQNFCAKDLKLEPRPIGDFSPAGHYDSKGVHAESDVARIFHGEAFAVYHLGVCYQISHDHRYAAKAESFLDSWATTTTRIGSEQGEDEVNFFAPFALSSAFILKQDPTWHSADFARFVREKFVPASHAHFKNNHANWGVLLDLTSGAFLNDQKLIQTSRDRWLQLMHSQVAADGSLPLEICRSDTTNWCGGPTKGINGISYEHWTLLPTTIAAEIFKNLGMDVYLTPAGALLHKAYQRAAEWTLAPNTFPYYAANGGHLNGVRNAAYFWILQRVFPEPAAEAVLQSPEGITADTLDLAALYPQPQMPSEK